MYDRLECVVLNGCETEEIGRSMLEVAARATKDGTPRISVVCWKTLAEDSAARAFGHGFYACVARQLEARRRKLHRNELSERSRFLPTADRGFVHFVTACVLPGCCHRRLRPERAPARHELAEAAFDAGCQNFWQENFAFGDPRTYLHEPNHEHMRNPDFSGECEGCTPPVHGQVVLLTCEAGKITPRLGLAPWDDLGEPSRSMRMKFLARLRVTRLEPACCSAARSRLARCPNLLLLCAPSCAPVAAPPRASTSSPPAPRDATSCPSAARAAARAARPRRG